MPLPHPIIGCMPKTTVPTEAEIQAALEKLKWEQDRLNWAIETAKNSPHLWQHKWKGTPLSILIEHAKKNNPRFISVERD